MTITLNEIRNAVIDYLNTSVTTSVSVPVPDAPIALSPGEEFTFRVTATNAAAPTGVPLVNVVYHVSISPGSVAKLKVPSSPPARASTNPSAPTLTVDDLVTEMFLFLLEDTLEVGQTKSLPNLKGKALGLGDPTITFEVYADIDQGFLYPTTTTDPDSTRQFSVI